MVAIENFHSYATHGIAKNDVDIYHWLVDRVLGKANGKLNHVQGTRRIHEVFGDAEPPKLGKTLASGIGPRAKAEYEGLWKCDAVRQRHTPLEVGWSMAHDHQHALVVITFESVGRMVEPEWTVNKLEECSTVYNVGVSDVFKECKRYPDDSCGMITSPIRMANTNVNRGLWISRHTNSLNFLHAITPAGTGLKSSGPPMTLAELSVFNVATLECDLASHS